MYKILIHFYYMMIFFYEPFCRRRMVIILLFVCDSITISSIYESFLQNVPLILKLPLNGRSWRNVSPLVLAANAIHDYVDIIRTIASHHKVNLSVFVFVTYERVCSLILAWIIQFYDQLMTRWCILWSLILSTWYLSFHLMKRRLSSRKG